MLITDFNDTHATLFFLFAVPPIVFHYHWFAGVDSLINGQCNLTYMNGSCAVNGHSWLVILAVTCHGAYGNGVWLLGIVNKLHSVVMNVGVSGGVFFHR